MNCLKHKSTYGAALAALLIIIPTVRSAPAGTWSARLGITYLDMANKSDAFTALSTNFASGAVQVSDRIIPEFDFAYWITENFSAELVLTIPQKHNVSLQGAGRLGTFKHLPPTLLAKYHFTTISENFRPYIGVGVNLTLISSVKLQVANVPLDLENSSIGLAGQVGFDYELGGGRFLNVDLKKVYIRSDVLAGGARLTTARLDPLLYSIGFGWRF
jgi:outer membrane protein